MERCIQCGAAAEPGLTRCAHHAALNAQHSGASHARALLDAQLMQLMLEAGHAGDVALIQRCVDALAGDAGARVALDALLRQRCA